MNELTNRDEQILIAIEETEERMNTNSQDEYNRALSDFYQRLRTLFQYIEP